MVHYFSQRLCKGDKIHNVEKINPSDDSFHGSKRQIAAEWWYFDAMFSDDISIHVGCRTFSIRRLGMVRPFLEFYKDGKLIKEKKQRFLFRNFKTSKDYPLVHIFKKPIIKFDYNLFKKEGKWKYDINLKIDDCYANLEFIGINEGFKIETDRESWTVALPKAKVTGEIKFNGKKRNVEGIGYHDHNWNYTFLTALTYGKCWYWGKIRSKNYNIVWANVIKKDNKWDILAVVNKEKEGFFNIKPEKIFFKPDDFIIDHKKKTPTSFIIKINDVVQNISIKAEIEMKENDLHYSTVLGSPYWRYHVKTKGYISIDGEEEKIDDIQIMEFLSFSK